MRAPFCSFRSTI